MHPSGIPALQRQIGVLVSSQPLVSSQIGMLIGESGVLGRLRVVTCSTDAVLASALCVLVWVWGLPEGEEKAGGKDDVKPSVLGVLGCEPGVFGGHLLVETRIRIVFHREVGVLGGAGVELRSEGAVSLGGGRVGSRVGTCPCGGGGGGGGHFDCGGGGFVWYVVGGGNRGGGGMQKDLVRRW